MRTILVINSKGGSGKTTLTVNLASYFASRGHKTGIMDYDPQGSSLEWLKTRPTNLASIHGANASPSKGTHLRSISMAIPSSLEYLIIDAPAGVDGILLQELISKTQYILIPMVPAVIDIHATRGFIKNLFLVTNLKSRKVKTALVANRVRRSVPLPESMDIFLETTELPFLGQMHDSDHFLSSIEQGMGIYEMDEQLTAQERNDFSPIIDWLMVNDQTLSGHDIAEKKLAFIDTVRLKKNDVDTTPFPRNQG